MHVLFLDNTDTVEASVKKLGEHLIQISGTEVNLSGFHLLNDAGSVFGKYEGFQTLYKENEDATFFPMMVVCISSLLSRSQNQFQSQHLTR